jgi:hypothetical protein
VESAQLADPIETISAPALKRHCYMVQHGRDIAQVVSRRPLTAESRVRTWVNPCRICGGQSGTGRDLSPSSSVFSCQYHSTVVSVLIYNMGV